MPRSLTGYLRTQDEVSVEAKIEALDLVAGRKQRSIQIRYSYHYLGKDYEYSGTEVALFGKREDFYSRLRYAYRTERSIRVWIDPEEPSFSVIERDWHWPTMITGFGFCGGFSVMGGTLIRFARRGLRRS
ncbi:DUF3592 domain-containing protein [Luteolibacter flavescens]